jgi:hypothetical protein
MTSSPATFERSALIRDWLYDLGVEKVTLLVIPAPELHPFFQRSPELAAWLLDRPRRRRRDRHARAPAPAYAAAASARRAGARLPGRRSDRVPRPRRGRDGRLPGRRAPRARHRRRARRAGSSPPATPTPGALREHLADRFDWWGTLLGVQAALGARTRRCASAPRPRSSARPSPALLRAAAALSGGCCGSTCHPADFEHPSHVHAVEAVLRRAHKRTAVTYDDLC